MYIKVPVPHNEVSTLDSDVAKKELVATYYSAQCLTITTARGLELYDKNTETQQARLVCIFHGGKFFVESSDDDMLIYRF
jgi:hypothetical protein